MSDDAKLIAALGGPAKVAAMLGYGKGGVQRVHNWISRGIPPRVKVERPDLFMRRDRSRVDSAKTDAVAAG